MIAKAMLTAYALGTATEIVPQIQGDPGFFDVTSIRHDKSVFALNLRKNHIDFRQNPAQNHQTSGHDSQ